MDFSPRTLNQLPNPAETVKAFVDAIAAGDYEKADSYIYNYASLGFEGEKESEDEFYSLFRSSLIESYKINFLTPEEELASSSDITPHEEQETVSPSDAKATTDGMNATVPIRFTFLDFNKVTDRLSEIAVGIAEKKKYNGYVYDSDEKANALLAESFEKLKKEGNMDVYLSDIELTVKLIFTDDSWKIIMEDDFYRVLLGGN
jgi:hypothetical protein